MVLKLESEDIIGLISSYLPYSEIINNLRNINNLWKNSINKSHYCWINIDLTETNFEDEYSNKNNLIEEIKTYHNIVTNIRLCNPKNNITGFLSQLIVKNDVGEFIKWNSLINIEIYNKSLIIPFENNSKDKLLPFKSLFRLGINENIIQILKKYDIEKEKKTDSFDEFEKIYSNLINCSPFNSLQRIIIDYPISTRELNILSNCFPSLKDIVITRLFHEKSELQEEHEYDEISSCWEAIYNFLQLIPPNQLRILQFNIIPAPNPLSGKWNIDHTISKVFTENKNIMNNNGDSKDLYKIVKRNNSEYIDKRNKLMRANEYYNINNNFNDYTNLESNLMLSFDEKGDKLMKYILDMHSESLVALSCSDLEVSYSLYKRLINCPKLKLWNLPGWRIFA